MQNKLWQRISEIIKQENLVKINVYIKTKGLSTRREPIFLPPKESEQNKLLKGLGFYRNSYQSKLNSYSISE